MQEAVRFIKNKIKDIDKKMQKDHNLMEEFGEYKYYKTEKGFYQACKLRDELQQVLKNLRVLEVLSDNLQIIGDSCIDFYQDEDRNINTKLNTCDCEIVLEWLKGKKYGA